MGINFPLTFPQPSSYLQPTISSWHQALLNRWLAQGLMRIYLSLALVRDEWYKKILHSCWMKKYSLVHPNGIITLYECGFEHGSFSKVV